MACILITEVNFYNNCNNKCEHALTSKTRITTLEFVLFVIQ